MPTTTKAPRTAKAKAKTTAAEHQPEEQEPQPEVEDNGDRLCECHCHTGMRKPGEIVTNWGFVWSVDESGFRMTSMIEAYAVLDGVKAGRYKPIEMDIKEARDIRMRHRFLLKFGNEPEKSMTFAELVAAVQPRRDKTKKLPDSLRI